MYVVRVQLYSDAITIVENGTDTICRAILFAVAIGTRLTTGSAFSA
jgi:hypothetical protein